MRRQATSVLLVILCAVTFNACVDVEVISEYREDGSASHAVLMEIDLVPADAEQREDIDDILADLEQRSTDAGLEFERSEKGGVISVQISGTTSEGEEAGAAINGLLNATGLSASPGITAPFRGTFTRETGAIGGSVYTLDLEADGQVLFDSIAVDFLGANDAERREAVSMRYVATLPGDITNTTGETITDSTVRWTIPFDTVTELSATSRTGGAGSVALFIIGGIVATMVILAIAIALGWYFAGRERLATVLGGAIHRLPGQQTITREGVWVARQIRGLTHRLSRDQPDERRER